MSTKLLHWFDSGRALDLGVLAEVERAMNVSFPEEFRKTITSHNAGAPHETDFMYQDPKIGDVEGCFGEFLSFDPNDSENVIEVVSRLAERLPESVIPFGATGDGGYVCFQFNTSDSEPSVVLWLHERPLSESLVFLADRFYEFISMLHEPEG